MKRKSRIFSTLIVETLESRLLMASDWQNAVNPRDVNASGLVTPLDVLLMVNKLNADQGGLLPTRGLGSQEPLCDVNGDGLLTPLDVLLVVNALNRYNTPLQVVAGLSPESDPNGNGVVLSPNVSFNGQTLPEVQISIQGLQSNAPILASTQSDTQGRFQLAVTLPDHANDLRFTVIDPLGRTAQIETRVSHGDVILDWNASALNVIREWTTVSNDPYEGRIVTSQPPLVARNLAMIHTAMYDAINAIESTHKSYLSGLPAPAANASPVAAAASAANQVAAQLYREPDELAVWQATLDEALSTVPEGDAKSLGIAFGQTVGTAVLASRATDGAGDSVTYIPGNVPGGWNRTLPDFLPSLLPQWPHVKPFALDTGDQFRPAPPPVLTSGAYASAVDEVMRLGSFGSPTRTVDQKDIALFWADGGGTFTPPGHWNQIAADVALGQQRSLAENARLFAMLNIALADAGIASWDAKYEYDLWRPIDAIRRADIDGNDSTFADPTWIPLIKTHPFPTYTSGHSTFSGAASTVLNAFFGTNLSFTSRADGHNGPSQRPLDPSVVTSRIFVNFDQAAEEAGISRIYGGIHFNFDNTAGLESGRLIGQYVVDRFLQSV